MCIYEERSDVGVHGGGRGGGRPPVPTGWRKRGYIRKEDDRPHPYPPRTRPSPAVKIPNNSSGLGHGDCHLFGAQLRTRRLRRRRDARSKHVRRTSVIICSWWLLVPSAPGRVATPEMIKLITLIYLNIRRRVSAPDRGVILLNIQLVE